MRSKCRALNLLPLLFIAFGTAFHTQPKSFEVRATDSVVRPIGMGVYWDKDCINRVLSIDWSAIALGSSKNIVVFVRNEGNESISLSVQSSNWNPPKAADFIALTWNYTGEALAPSQVVPISLSLSVSIGIEAVNTFSFDISIPGKEISSLVRMVTISSCGLVLYTEVVNAILDVHPQTLNLQSMGKWITAYIELPKGYSMSDVNFSTIRLNDALQAQPMPIKIGDYDGSGVLYLMVKFDRTKVIQLLSVGENTLLVTGKVRGIPFKGSDTINVIG